MYSKYRKSVLTSSIALALMSASGAALAGAPCEKDDAHNGTTNNQTNMSGQANVPDHANARGHANNSNQANVPGHANARRQANMQNRGYSNQNIDAVRQETQIQTTYSLNSNLRANDLQVSVRDGKATLTGTVEEETSKDLANTIALGVTGINSVDNQIRVEPGYTPVTQTSQERNYGEAVEDATITAAVKSKLLWSKNTDGMETDVDTTNGRVTLTGTARSDAAKALAETTAANTSGVVSVDNRLVVDPSQAESGFADNVYVGDGSTGISDSWITTKVNATFAYSANVEGNEIEVGTDQGVVTLSGTVDNDEERYQAIELAENVRGVISVEASELTLVNRSVSMTGTGLTQNINNPDPE